MGWKSQASKHVFSEWGEVLGKKVFGKNIPTNVKPLLSDGENAISKMDAFTFSNAIDVDNEVREPLNQLLRSAGDGNDDAFGILADTARDFQLEDQGQRVLSTVNKRLNSPKTEGKIPTTNKVPTDTSGKLGRSKAHKAWKGTNKVGPLSLIAGTPAKIIKAEPHNANKAMAWAREAYAYAQQGKSGNKAQPLRGFRRYVGEDGTLYKPKTLTGAGKGYQLKFPSMDLLKGYDDLRKLREAPWRKQEVIDRLQDILNKKGKEDKLDDLLKLMVKDYHTKLKGIKAAKQTKGHFISLAQGGLDIAENFGPQRGRSIKTKSGKWEAGNYAEGAGSSIPEGVSVPRTWEEYVDLKLPLLK